MRKKKGKKRRKGWTKNEKIMEGKWKKIIVKSIKEEKKGKESVE